MVAMTTFLDRGHHWGSTLVALQYPFLWVGYTYLVEGDLQTMFLGCDLYRSWWLSYVSCRPPLQGMVVTPIILSNNTIGGTLWGCGWVQGN